MSTIAAGMQGRASSFLNFAAGSIFLVIAQAVSGILLWMQAMALQIAKLTRLSTSYGSDADSWVADFGIIERIGAVAATGLVVFSRYTPSASAPVIPIGATVKTGDGTQSFMVYADTTNPAYSATATGTTQSPIPGYVMPAQVTSVTVPVVSITPSTTNASGDPGTNGNVAAGAISLIGTQINGVDAVTNSAAFTNGSDDESDPAFKARFRLAIASLSEATPTAVSNAVAALGTDLQSDLAEGVNLAGAPQPGFIVVVDDGSGDPSAGLVQEASAAVNAVRAAGMPYGCFGAQTSLVAATMQISSGTGYDHDTVVAQVAAALGLWINGSGLGNGVTYFRGAAVALAVPGCTGILPGTYTLNGATADLPGSLQTTYKAGMLTVS